MSALFGWTFHAAKRSSGKPEGQLSTCLRQMYESGRMKSVMSVHLPERLGGLRPSGLSRRPV